MISNITAPQPLTDKHEVSSFECGEPALNEWIKKRALKNERHGASRTYVICEGNVVIGYYALATGSIDHKKAPPGIRRNMPDPVPVMILGRLAIDQKHQKKQLGSSLLRDALLRTLQVSQMAGTKALMVEAISDKAKSFYKKHGFRDSPIEDRLLFITITEAESCL